MDKKEGPEVSETCFPTNTHLLLAIGDEYSLAGRQEAAQSSHLCGPLTAEPWGIVAPSFLGGVRIHCGCNDATTGCLPI